MSLIPLIAADLGAEQGYAAGFQHLKQAGDATPTYSLAGRLYASSSGWLLLSVPNAVVRGLFDAMDEPGIQLPTRDTDDPQSTLNAHISVARPEELEPLGGVSAITERGHMFRFQLGPLKTVVPYGWNKVSRVWFVHIESPELKALRRSYGLTALPMRGNEELPFHCTVAIRRKGVLHENEVSKAAAPTKPPSHRDTIEALREAKFRSDQSDYAAKNAILQEIMRRNPQAWEVDTPGRMAGVTHTPTGFKFHMPVSLIVPGVPGRRR